MLLQTLPRAATGERMNPYNSVWTGVTPGDGPQNLHVVLLDNGRSDLLAEDMTRQTLQCIRCAACLNACPVYRQTGGHAYGSVYSGPIGAILTPQLHQMEYGQSLPYASSLCGACYEVCPVKINIPEVLVYLRSRVVDKNKHKLSSILSQERIGMKMMARIFLSNDRFEKAQRMARALEKPFVGKDGWVTSFPGSRVSGPQGAIWKHFPNRRFAIGGEAATARRRTIVSKEDVLARVRAALRGEKKASQPSAPETYTRNGALGAEDKLLLLEERLSEYDARVFRCSEADLARQIADVLLQWRQIENASSPRTSNAVAGRADYMDSRFG